MSKPEKPEYGSFLEWTDIEKHAELFHDLSVQHLIDIWSVIRDRVGDPSTWGDEIEYQILGFDTQKKEVNLVMKQDAVLEKLSWSNFGIDIQPEYTKYMVESAPSQPYFANDDLPNVYKSLSERRKAINSTMKSNEAAFTLSLFPLLHVSELSKALNASVEEHQAILKEAVAPVGRYQILHKNLVNRSTRAYHAEVPLFMDTNTSNALKDASADVLKASNQQPVIHLEDIIFAMGGCALQVTFQSRTLSDVQKLHDQLCVLGPILLALTASTPIYKGMLADSDTRWNQACSMVDDRTPEEMGELSARWSTSTMFLSKEHVIRETKSVIHRDEKIEAQLIKAGVDPVMALYFANLHLRDPLVLYGEESSVKNMSAADIHQSICGSVWSHVRLKVPRAELPEGITPEQEGWRVEFRPMEIQLTDFANASVLVFMQLLRDILEKYDLDVYIPIDLVRENMNRAHSKNSVIDEKFWFPRNPHSKEYDLVEMTIDEIMNGPKDAEEGNLASDRFEGFLPFIRKNIDQELYENIEQHLDFIRDRASGHQQTPAAWQREFVLNHSEYAHDSVVTQQIAYDMLRKIKGMNE